MTARDRFAVHQRIKLSADGEGQFRNWHAATKRGIVRGFGHSDDQVRVQRDALKTVGSYHMSLWEPDR